MLGVIDYTTGFEISFAVFYVGPVALAAWFIHRNSGLFVSGMSALTWSIANMLAGETFSNVLIPFWNAATRAGFFIMITLLLAELRRQFDNERNFARTDPLTGALNRRAFYEIADREISRSTRSRHPLTLVYFDLDNFKNINDRKGHATGDILLQMVGAALIHSIRHHDYAARLGGDEFVVLLTETGQQAGRKIVPRIHQALLDVMSNHKWQVTFSIGVLTCEQPFPTVDEIIVQADRLMYQVKSSGKNSVAYATFRAS